MALLSFINLSCIKYNTCHFTFIISYNTVLSRNFKSTLVSYFVGTKYKKKTQLSRGTPLFQEDTQSHLS